MPLSEAHLGSTLREWVAHYNRRRSHSSLGPGIPQRAVIAPVLKEHRIPDGHRVVSKPDGRVRRCSGPKGLKLRTSSRV